MFLERLCRRQDTLEVAHILRRYTKEEFPEIMCMIIMRWAAGKRENPVKAAEKITALMYRMYRREGR